MAISPPPSPDSTGVPWALFLDVDGTLADIADHPNSVIIPERLPIILRRLRQLLGEAIALISGRSLASLDRLIGVAEFDAAGCHGAELRMRGRKIMPIGTATDLRGLADRITRRASQIPGTLIEAKPYSIAFHYRHSLLSNTDAHAFVVDAIGEKKDGIRIISGKKVVEIVPADAGKGRAIARFMAELPYKGRRPVFIGDDATDEDGFGEVNRLDGVSVRVGRGETAARHGIDSAGDVVQWLAGPVIDTLEKLAGRVSK